MPEPAEAFINYVSRPDNVVRNMYYVGYTSVISGGDDPTIFEYADWNFGAEEDEEETEDYPLGYFFSEDGDPDGEYVITAPADQVERQLFAQYPSEEAIAHTSIMTYFDEKENEAINKMWINVRCFDIRTVPAWIWIAAAGAAVLLLLLYRRRRRAKAIE